MSKVTEYLYPNAIVRIHEDKPIDMDKLKEACLRFVNAVGYDRIKGNGAR